MGIPLWEATRPGSQTKGWAFTMVGCANAFNVASAAPDTTTVASWNTSSAGTGLLVWRAWQGASQVPELRYDFGVRISCKSMGTAYLTFEYSVNSGAAWNALITSVGGSNLAATTITRSMAATTNPGSLLIRMSQTNAHTIGRAQLWDVYLVGSYMATEAHSRVISDAMALYDCGAEPNYTDDFNRANGSPGANWVIYADCKSGDISNNLLKRAISDDLGLYWNGGSLNGGQWGSVRIASLYDNALFFRLQPTSLKNGYVWEAASIISGPWISFGVFSESNFTLVSCFAVPGLAANQTIGFTAFSSQLILTWGNTVSLVTSDALFTSGWTGIYGSGNRVRFDDFACGNYHPVDYWLTGGGGGTAFTREVADALGMSDAQYRVIAYGRKLVESIGLTDARDYVKALYRYVSDTAGRTDAIDRDVTFLRFAADNLGVTDEEWRGVTWKRYFTDALGIEDAEAVAKGQQRILSDALGIADVANRLFTAKRYQGDALGISDAYSRRQDFARQLAEALGIDDQEVRRVVFSRQATEALGLTDTAGAIKLLLRTIADVLGMTDQEIEARGFYRIFADTVGLADAQRRASALRRILSDVEGISDASLRRVSFLRTLTEALGIDDRESVLKMICRAISDAVGITDYRDVASAAPQILRTIADTLSIADAMTVSKLAVIIRTIAENLGITDARWAAKAVRRILSEQFGITDYEDETKAIRRYLAEIVGLTDDQERTALIIRNLTEAAGITDAAVGGLSQYILRIIADDLGLTDSVSKIAALLTWLALLIAVDYPAVDNELAGPAVELQVEKVIREEVAEETVDSEVLPPAIKTEVE